MDSGLGEDRPGGEPPCWPFQRAKTDLQQQEEINLVLHFLRKGRFSYPIALARKFPRAKAPELFVGFTLWKYGHDMT